MTFCSRTYSRKGTGSEKPLTFLEQMPTSVTTSFENKNVIASLNEFMMSSYLIIIEGSSLVLKHIAYYLLY